jgi:signal transduction histidine kinase
VGLAVAKKIIERHGGTIGVNSALGAGTTFTIDLPCSPPASDSTVA